MNRVSPCVSLRAVDVAYPADGPHGPIQALSGVHLNLNPGERVALVGPNGSGKSSLLRVLAGLTAVSPGSMVQASGLRAVMLFQRPHMLRATALHNVALALWLQGRSWRQARVAATQVLAQFGLTALSGQNARTLSGGQQQRLALARAWACRPDLLLLDEPTASLDLQASGEVEALLGRLAQEPDANPGLTMVFACHHLGLVKRLANRVIFLDRGKILADLSALEFFQPEALRQASEAAFLFVQGELTL